MGKQLRNEEYRWSEEEGITIQNELDGFGEIVDDVYTEELDEALIEVGNLLCKITDENQPETMKDLMWI